MTEKINIAELLKDCPSGMELDCTMIDNVVFEKLDVRSSHHPIIIRRTDSKDSNTTIHLTKYGQYSDEEDYKCVIYPKGKITWEGFVPPGKFKDGDIVATTNGLWIGITTGGKSGESIPTYCVTTGTGGFEAYFNYREKWKFQRLATKEEKAKLFKAIKNNGYKWNEETKTLEKLINRNKFTIGAIVTNGKIKGKICSRDVDSYKLEDGTYIFFNEVHNWELVPNKFDISTLNPFDRVLVRDKCSDMWTANFYSHYDATSDKPFVCVGWSEMNEYRYCIPYEANKELLGTTNNIE